MSDEPLDGLRRKVRELDGEILRLIRERMGVARAIGEAKKARALPLRDFAIEKQVLARAATRAEELGLAPDLARTVMQLLIAEACLVQEQEQFSGYEGDAESILIVGGRGKMGAWFARFFASQGHRVEIWDVRQGEADFPSPNDLAAGLERASLAVVATSLDRVGEAIREITERGFRGTLFDIASLKGHFRSELEEARRRGIAVASIHPMFGPNARTLSDKVICVCDCGDPGALARVEGLFRDTAATLVRLSLEEHDRIASYVLGLSHLLNLVFARVVARSGFSLAALKAIGSTTFLSQMRTTGTVIREEPDLYYAIQSLNPNTPEVYTELAAAVSEWTSWVLEGDSAAFARAMEESLRWLGDE